MVDATATKLSDQWQLCFSKKPDSFFCSEQKESMGWRRVWETGPSGGRMAIVWVVPAQQPRDPCLGGPKEGWQGFKALYERSSPLAVYQVNSVCGPSLS